GASGGSGGGGQAGASSSSTGDGGDLGIDGGMTDSGSGGGPPTCNPGGPNDDVDKDGFTPMQGDCDDCDPNSNPNAVEVIATDGSTPKDENCNGTVDEVDPPCDDNFVVDDIDPLDAVRSVDLCKMSTGVADWGIVDA